MGVRSSLTVDHSSDLMTTILLSKDLVDRLTPSRMSTIKTTATQRISAGEHVEKLKFFSTIGGNVKWCSHYMGVAQKI